MDDGKYICYEEDKYIIEFSGRRLSIPVVNIYDFNKKELVYTIDYYDAELKNQWGVGATITYNNKTNSININFDIENQIYLSGRFDLKSMTFIKDEREYPYTRSKNNS